MRKALNYKQTNKQSVFVVKLWEWGFNRNSKYMLGTRSVPGTISGVYGGTQDRKQTNK